MRCLDSTTYTMDMNLSKLWVIITNSLYSKPFVSMI